MHSEKPARVHVPAGCSADDENDAVLFEKIKKGEYDADDPIWDQVSLPAKDLVVGTAAYS